MKPSKIALQRLREHGVKPSLQRLAILKYLLQSKKHPTADMIYGELKGELPTLSKATVYNTLNLLSELGAVREVSIGMQERRFEGIIEPHGHLVCRECGKLHDVELGAKIIKRSMQVPCEHSLEGVDIYFSGVCKDCVKRANQRSNSGGSGKES